MAKGIKCTLVVNTKWGYVFTPSKHNSIADAVRTAKDNCGGFAYRIYNEDGELIKQGFCY